MDFNNASESSFTKYSKSKIGLAPTSKYFFYNFFLLKSKIQ